MVVGPNAVKPYTIAKSIFDALGGGRNRVASLDADIANVNAERVQMRDDARINMGLRLATHKRAQLHARQLPQAVKLFNGFSTPPSAPSEFL